MRWLRMIEPLFKRFDHKDVAEEEEIVENITAKL